MVAWEIRRYPLVRFWRRVTIDGALVGQIWQDFWELGVNCPVFFGDRINIKKM